MTIRSTEGMYACLWRRLKRLCVQRRTPGETLQALIDAMTLRSTVGMYARLCCRLRQLYDQRRTPRKALQARRDHWVDLKAFSLILTLTLGPRAFPCFGLIR